MIRTFIQVLSLTTAFISSYFLIRGTFALSVKDVAELSLSKFGGNTDVMNNLTSNKANTIGGFTLLLTSFILQLVNLIWPLRAVDFEINQVGVALALLVTLIILILAVYITNIIQNKYFLQAKKLFDERLIKK